jgi:hypothetical protein
MHRKCAKYAQCASLILLNFVTARSFVAKYRLGLGLTRDCMHRKCAKYAQCASLILLNFVTARSFVANGHVRSFIHTELKYKMKVFHCISHGALPDATTGLRHHVMILA